MTTTAVKKKLLRVTISVSRTNANRVRFGTHTLASALELEGYKVEGDRVYVEDHPYHLSGVTLEARPRKEGARLQLVESK